MPVNVSWGGSERDAVRTVECSQSSAYHSVACERTVGLFGETAADFTDSLRLVSCIGRCSSRRRSRAPRTWRSMKHCWSGRGRPTKPYFACTAGPDRPYRSDGIKRPAVRTNPRAHEIAASRSCVVRLAADRCSTIGRSLTASRHRSLRTARSANRTPASIVYSSTGYRGSVWPLKWPRRAIARYHRPRRLVSNDPLPASSSWTDGSWLEAPSGEMKEPCCSTDRFSWRTINRS